MLSQNIFFNHIGKFLLFYIQNMLLQSVGGDAFTREIMCNFENTTLNFYTLLRMAHNLWFSWWTAA
jgi:hypothetical protein